MVVGIMLIILLPIRRCCQVLVVAIVYLVAERVISGFWPFGLAAPRCLTLSYRTLISTAFSHHDVLPPELRVVIGVHYQSADRWLRDFSTAYFVLVSTPYSWRSVTIHPNVHPSSVVMSFHHPSLMSVHHPLP
jgi:hypothetical protein